MRKPFFERTLQSSFSLKGRGLFTGEDTALTVSPAEKGKGIWFRKISGACQSLFPATIASLYSADQRMTMLSDGSDAGSVACAEHLLSALAGCGITNAEIIVEGNEIPILDGSALPFVEKIQEVGFQEQGAVERVKFLDRPFYWSQGNVHIIALPSDELRFSYTLSYEGHPLLASQFVTFPFNKQGCDCYRDQIAPARTFCLYEEAESLMQQGRVHGGSLECAVVIRDEEIINPGGLRSSNEMACHKVLDMIGDFSLIGEPVVAHFIGIRSGHEANAIVAKKIAAHVEEKEERFAGEVMV